MNAIIEQFEPDVHQFFPVDVVGKNGDLFAKYYFFIVCNRLERVINWLVQKLAIASTPTQVKPTEIQSSGSSFQGAVNVTTDTIANITNAESGADLILAAAAQIHFGQGKQKFTRQELITEMRTAPGHFKETFVNNMSKYLVGLTKADRLRLVGQNTYALSNKERQAMETALANAG